MFTHGRIVQELGREGILPWSSFFASDWPFNTPMAGLFAQWIMSSLYILLPPPGDAYLFVLSCTSTSLSYGLWFDSRQFINDRSSSVILPRRSDQRVCLCGAFIHPLPPNGGVWIGLEPTIPRVHGSDLVFLCIKRVPGGGSMGPTCPWVPGLRANTILRE